MCMNSKNFCGRSVLMDEGIDTYTQSFVEYLSVTFRVKCKDFSHGDLPNDMEKSS